MKVILVQEVKKLGKKGDIIEVSEGYARNYLLPQKLAIPATEANINAAKQQKETEARRQQRQLDEARLLASQLAKLSVKVAVKTGEGGKLFGSVTGKDIADALSAQHGLEIDKRKIELKEAIKALGTYPVTIKVHPEVSCQIQVQVIAQ
ncbi:50S ribosomal protein L9 [Sporolituus thermophilus]|uniref:Large ribosomal subunit protein bL9 n=1 Tax=Sporolituus thermophilus DSM 23256 TaxID=1123285 RepID=A0A1G7L0E8_9FIRM|nr:50S ribosomal protein L9 [Sporolituus thermophilus]SDF42923.1 large subunit ribosomal protein L9 [Sporolituus thermophilus DSM 23256]